MTYFFSRQRMGSEFRIIDSLDYPKAELRQVLKTVTDEGFFKVTRQGSGTKETVATPSPAWVFGSNFPPAFPSAFAPAFPNARMAVPMMAFNSMGSNCYSVDTIMRNNRMYVQLYACE